MQKEAEIVLGVDPGTATTGYGVIRCTANRFQLIDCGVIRTAPNVPLSQRYKTLYLSLCDLIKKYSPQAASVETQFVHRNPQSAIKLGMARGMLLLAAALNGVEVFEYAPSEAKLAVTGSGRATKECVKKMVGHLVAFSMENIPEDATDALAIAVCHAQSAASKRQLGVKL